MTYSDIVEFLQDNEMEVTADNVDAIEQVYRDGFAEGHNVGFRRGLKEVYKEAE